MAQSLLLVGLALMAPQAIHGDVDASAIILKDHPQKCLDLKNGDTTNGNTLQIWDCNAGHNQGWIFKGDTLVYKQDQTKCVDLKDGNDANGNLIQIWDCTGEVEHSGNQGWTYESGSLGIRHKGSKGRKCIDLKGGITTNGMEVQIWDCNESEAQRFLLATENLEDYEPSSTGYVLTIIAIAIALVASLGVNLCLYMRRKHQAASKSEKKAFTSPTTLGQPAPPQLADVNGVEVEVGGFNN